MDRTIFFLKAERLFSKENIVHHKRSYPRKLPITSFPLPHLIEIHKVSEQSLPPPLPSPPLPSPTLLTHTKYTVKRQVTHYLRITNLHKFYCLRREHDPQGRNNEKIQKSFDKNESKLEEQQHIHQYLNNEQKDSVQYITE